MEESQEQLQQDDALLKWASSQLNGIPQNKKFRIGRAESHNDMKLREKRKLGIKRPKVFLWMSYAVAVLNEQNKFMKFEDLWKIVENKYGVVNRLHELGKSKELSKIKHSAINACWIANCKSTRKDNVHGKLIDIGERVGLKEWTDQEFKPLQKYI